MHCPYCHTENSQVSDSRVIEEGRVIRRRRRCTRCDRRFTTFERAEELPLPQVVKKDGARVDFSHAKLAESLHLALRKRPVPTASVDRALVDIEETLRQQNEREVSSQTIGALVLEALKKLDKVAYIRFASVYLNFADEEAFSRLIDEIRHLSCADTNQASTTS